MEEAHGDGIRALGPYALDGSVDRLFVERPDDLAVRADAFFYLEPQPTRDEGCRRLVEEAVEVRHSETPELQHVTEALGGDQGGLGALVLQDGVAGDRRPVDDLADRRFVDAALAQSLYRAVENALSVVGGRGWDFLRVVFAVRAEQNNVRKGAADVGTESICRFVVTDSVTP